MEKIGSICESEYNHINLLYQQITEVDNTSQNRDNLNDEKLSKLQQELNALNTSVSIDQTQNRQMLMNTQSIMRLESLSKIVEEDIKQIKQRINYLTRNA